MGASRGALSWQEQALCAQIDMDLWFPSSMGGGSSDAAVSVCCRCPVVDECLSYAMECEARDRRRFGVWGGLTPDERERLACARVVAS
ncbi:WhiB family transcriptional regulator [Actinomyces faecalis]|uniref:WhiB family transcriptional regulator n=1 Tax=Actinomyces faecalis TaxID=2722820 RepID=UPI001FD226DB|nr:WhiB family transcriptional regulator [Actinomyces faecalis]